MSLLTIQATDTNATLDNGVYSCQVTLTIFGVDNFNKTSNSSVVLFKGRHRCVQQMLLLTDTIDLLLLLLY